jgi:hypothetical protein
LPRCDQKDPVWALMPSAKRVRLRIVVTHIASGSSAKLG